MILNFSFFKPKTSKIVFFGDSITEMGVQKGAYIDLLRQYLLQDTLSEKYSIEGAGIGGNKIYDLYLRMEDDVLAKKPDVVVIWVGINDVWHKKLFGTGTDADKFEKFYKAIIKKMQAKGIKVVLVTPALIGEYTDFSNDSDGELNHFANLIRQIAAENSCELVDMRQVFLQYNRLHNKENKETGILTADKVHLNGEGNKLAAETFYNFLIKK
jgi:lysophospholipase L1-like esterase